jgi:hypothetical protein
MPESTSGGRTFAESISLSSTCPADFRLPATASATGFNLLAPRARRMGDTRARPGPVQGPPRRSCRNLRGGILGDFFRGRPAPAPGTGARAVRARASALEGALGACPRLAPLRRADAVDGSLGRRLRRLRGRGARRPLPRRRRPRVRGLLPRRHRGDDRPFARAHGPGGRRAGEGRDHADAAERGRDLGRGRARAALRAAAVAVRGDGYRREPLRDPARSRAVPPRTASSRTC